MKFSIAAIGLTYACAAQATIQILHRHVSHDAEEEYSVRGTVGQLDANGTARLQAGPAESVATRDNWEIYQLLAASDDVPASEWPMTSIPACRMRRTRPKETLQDKISLTIGQGGHPVSIGYTTSAPLKACNPPTDASYALAGWSEWNTTVQVSYPNKIPAPRLHAPANVKINEDGSEAPKEPEKTFFQKYWLYLLPVVIIILTGAAGGGEEGAPKKD